MNLRLCSLGFIVLAGCAGTTTETPKATAPTEPAAQSTPGGGNNISVPNMT